MQIKSLYVCIALYAGYKKSRTTLFMWFFNMREIQDGEEIKIFISVLLKS